MRSAEVAQRTKVCLNEMANPRQAMFSLYLLGERAAYIALINSSHINVLVLSVLVYELTSTATYYNEVS